MIPKCSYIHVLWILHVFTSQHFPSQIFFALYLLQHLWICCQFLFSFWPFFTKFNTFTFYHLSMNALKVGTPSSFFCTIHHSLPPCTTHKRTLSSTQQCLQSWKWPSLVLLIMIATQKLKNVHLDLGPLKTFFLNHNKTE